MSKRRENAELVGVKRVAGKVEELVRASLNLA